MARDDELAGIRAAFDYQRSLVANSGLTDDSFKATQKLVKELFQEMLHNLSPWVSSKELKTKQINNLVDAYKMYVGDPDDPEFQRKLRIDMERQGQAEVVPVKVETDDERINRLIAEREANYRRTRT